MTFAALTSLVSFLEPIVADVAPPILAAVRAEIAAHSGMTEDQRNTLLGQLQDKILDDQKIVDGLTANATPDPV